MKPYTGIRLSKAVYDPIAADAEALGMSVATVLALVVAEGLEVSRAKRYAPFKLPADYQFGNAVKRVDDDETPDPRKIRRLEIR